MDWKKLSPWNWFKKENEQDAHRIPVMQKGAYPAGANSYSPLNQLHTELDRAFDQMWSNFGRHSPFQEGGSLLPEFNTSGFLKPSLDIKETNNAFEISVEIPGVEEKDIELSLDGDTLTIKGEKHQEKKEEKDNYHRVERAYGSFQRLLSLPENANGDEIKASFKNGLLLITLPKSEPAKPAGRKIEIESE